MSESKGIYSADEVKAICLEAGADDAGLVNLERPALDGEREGIRLVYSLTRSIISLIFVNNRENIQSPARYVANEEYHHTGDRASHVCRDILRRLNRIGIRGVVVNREWPMALDRMPGKAWDVSHKIMAVEAGLGHMGLNRLVLHPRYGSCVQLESILIDGEMDAYDAPLEDSPCIHCNLCAAACPTGAITQDRPFDFMACLTHNYRDNYIGFQNMMEALVTSRDMDEYRAQFDERETGLMWQSLMYRMGYRCSHCMAVCPAGQDVLPLFSDNKKAYVDRVVKPLKDRRERIYVTPGSPAETAAGQNPNKEIWPVKGMVRSVPR